MRINSATIGMESERTYSATQARVSRLTRFSGKQSIMDGSGTLFVKKSQIEGRTKLRIWPLNKIGNVK